MSEYWKLHPESIKSHKANPQTDVLLSLLPWKNCLLLQSYQRHRQACINQTSQPPDSSASTDISGWPEPGNPVEEDFSSNKCWNASEDTILGTLAFFSLGGPSQSSQYDDRYDIESIWEDYEYETAFAVGDYVRIQGQRNSQWAENDGMGTYWSKKAYRVVEIRMAHESLKPTVDAAESGSDEGEEYTSEDGEYNDAKRGLMGDTQQPLTAEMKVILGTRVWYYRLDMSTDNTAHPLAEAMWWAEDQLVFDAEANSVGDDQEMEDDSGVEDQEMYDDPGVEDDKQSGLAAMADLSLQMDCHQVLAGHFNRTFEEWRRPCQTRQFLR